MASGEPLRGTVSKVVKGGVLVDIGVRAFLPVSQIEPAPRRQPRRATSGQELDCLVAEADRTTDKIVLTRRSLLRRLDRQRTGELLAGLSEGQTLKGVVTRLADYGAFVRVLDRIEGLVHVSELAEYRVHLPEEVVIPGDEVMVKVLRIDRRRRRRRPVREPGRPVRRRRRQPLSAGDPGSRSWLSTPAPRAPVLVVTIDRPEARNAVDGPTAAGARRGVPRLRRRRAGSRSRSSPARTARSAPAPTSRPSRPAAATGSTCRTATDRWAPPGCCSASR